MTITTSAPGKLMLFGEHAVVYGYPCIVTAISERLYITEGESDYKGDTRFIDAAVKAWGKGDEKLSAKSAFSGKYGFGSSSAVTVAALKALRPNANSREIFDTGYKIVLDIQGKGSGFDVAAAIYGGTLYFVTGGKVIEPIRFRESNSQTISPIHARYRESNDQIVSNIPLIVGYTGVKADTVTLINQVAEKKAHNPEKVERIFDAIAKLVEEAKIKMLDGDWERVGKLMDFNQEYLRDLGVSSEKLESLISAAKRAGAYGAKLSGAGGGDCMIVLARSDKQEVINKAIKEAGGEVIDVTPNAEGVRVEL